MYVWLLSPIPYSISRWVEPKKTPLNNFQVLKTKALHILSDAFRCDKCSAFWSGITYSIVTGLNPLEMVIFACTTVVITKIIYNNVP